MLGDDDELVTMTIRTATMVTLMKMQVIHEDNDIDVDEEEL